MLKSQVAVAIPNFPGLDTLLKNFRVLIQESDLHVLDFAFLLRIDEAGVEALCLLEVLNYVSADATCATERIDGVRMCGPGVKAGQTLCQAPYVILRELVALQKDVSPLLIIKPAHEDRVIDDDAFAFHTVNSIRVQRDRNDALVYTFAKSLVELKLLLTGFTPFVHGGKIKEAQRHGFLYLDDRSVPDEYP
jgi:hypothetical protein